MVLILQVAGTLEQRSEQEVFYSCPSSSALAFFDAVSSQVAALEESPYASNPSSQLEQVVEVVQAVEVSALLASGSNASFVLLSQTAPNTKACRGASIY